jgi:penicillin-binding protein 1A
MSGSLSFFSAIFAGFGMLLSSPLGPAQLPRADMEELRARANPGYVARIHDASGSEIGEFFRDGPLASPPAKLPQEFLNAVLAIEDRRFYEHDGIDPIGLASAIASQFGPSPRGGSTIDQQMAKNAWTGSEETLNRKIAEAVLAMRARHLLGPDGVLQAYLETAWFGRGVTGAAGAAHAWFGRDWHDLSIGEMAYLAGILKGPGFYDAERHPQRATQRRDQVIAAMLREGFITEEEAEAARAETLTPGPRPLSAQRVEDRWFVSAARPEIVRAIDSSPAWDSLFADVDIELSLSPDWQRIAQTALASGVRSISGAQPLAVVDDSTLAALREARSTPAELRRISRRHLSRVLPWDSDARAAILLEQEGEEWTFMFGTGLVRTAPLSATGNLRLRAGQVLALRELGEGYTATGRSTIEGAVVIIDPRDGSLIASVGGSDPSISAFDRTRARRQPGSAIKTFLWLAALEYGLHPDSLVPDIEQTYYTDSGELWRPRNYRRTQSGMVTLSWAYERSSNLVAAALVNEIGVETMAQFAERSGAYASGMPRHLSAALGSVELTLLDLTRAHAAVINGGIPREVNVIRDMQADGRPITSGRVPGTQERFGVDAIANRFFLDDMVSMMEGVVRRGTAARAFADHPVMVVGKTGTSQGYRDAWFIGLTPHVAVGVWLGRDDDRPMGSGMAGGRYAAPVVAQILADAYNAGLIDAYGLRDDDRALNITWPPAPLPVQMVSEVVPLTGNLTVIEEAAPAIREPAPQPSRVQRSAPTAPGGAPSMGGQVQAGQR